MLVLSPNFTNREMTWTQFKSFKTAKNFNIQYESENGRYIIYGYDSPEVYVSYIYQSEVPESVLVRYSQEQNDADKADFLANYAPTSNKIINPVQPFAEPTHRMRLVAIDSIIDAPANDTTTIEYQLASELYTNGGELIIQNAEFGDYVEVMFYDKDGVIPAPYRAALCEAWPVVATYILKQFVFPTGTYSKVVFDTKPLIAKVTAGLYVKTVYHAVNTGSTRKLAQNYYFLRKL